MAEPSAPIELSAEDALRYLLDSQAALSAEVASLRQATAALGKRSEEIAAFANTLLKSHEEVVAHAKGLAQLIANGERGLEGLEKGVLDEVGRLRDEADQRAERLRGEIAETAAGLSQLRQNLNAWQETVETRVGAVKEGWAGVMGSLNEMTGKLREENERQIAPWRELAQSLERRVATLEAAWPLLSTAVPEGIFRKVKQETAGLDLRIADLEKRLLRRGL